MCYNKRVMGHFRKITAIIAAAAASLTLAGCTGGCSGCGGAKISNSALTNSNWYTQTGYKGIQPYFIDGNGNAHETLVYTVANESKSNGFYKAEYYDGEYRTDFYACEYDWNDAKIPESCRTENKDLVYRYETEFTVSGRFIMGERTKEFTDRVKTVSVFRAAQFNLQPVYSKQEIKSTTPAVLRPANLESAYEEFDAVYENYYNRGCTEVLSFKTQDGQTESKTYRKLNKTSNTLFDNSSLYTAIRSMKLSDSFAQTIDLFIAQSGGISTVKLNGADDKIEKEELAKISAALAEKRLYTPVTKDDDGNAIEDKGVATTAVTVAYNGGNMSGNKQTVWYAALTDADNNLSRCTMLKISLQLPFGLGSLDFSLKEVESAIWDGVVFEPMNG